MDTLVETLNTLRKKGYTEDFNLKKNCLECRSDGFRLFAKDFSVEQFYRFDGDTDPSEESILYVISSHDHKRKGVLIDAFGIYSDPIASDMMDKLSIRNISHWDDTKENGKHSNKEAAQLGKGWPSKITLLLASTLTVMSGATISPSLPQIRDVFAATPNAEMLSRLVLTIPAIFIAVCAPLAGYIVDRFGRKPLLLISLVLYGLAGSSGLYLDSLTSILIGRALLGISVAGIMTTVVTLIGDYFEGEERSGFMGLQAAFMGIGGVVFISGGGYLADIGWRWPFAIYFFSWLILPLAWRYLAEPAGASPDQPKTGSQQDIDYPRLTISLLFITVVLNMIMFYMVPVQMPFFLSETIKVNNTLAGIAISLITFSSAITSLFYQRIKAKLGFYRIYAVVFLMMSIGYFLISQSTTYGMVVPALLIAGVGAGLFLPNINLHIMTLAPAKLRGRLVSGVTSAMFLGQFLSPLAVAPLVADFSLAQTFGFASAGMGVMAIGFVILGFLPKNSGFENTYSE